MTYRTLLILLLASHWPVGLWYVRRMTDGSDEPLGLLALLTSFAFIPWRRLSRKVPVIWLAGIVLMEVAFQVFAGTWVPLFRAIWVVGMLAVILIHLRSPAGISGLLFLSLPWIATLQFYLGFPLRVLTGEVTRWLLLAIGFDVQREGITLLWHNQIVVIDRPCAGIYMLWFGGYLSYLLACVYEIPFRRCLILGVYSFCIILVANIARNFALFFVETKLLALPAFAHDGVGVVLFLLAIGSLIKITETKVPGRALRSAD